MNKSYYIASHFSAITHAFNKLFNRSLFLQYLDELYIIYKDK